ncbi:LexA family protein [Helcococcus sueciensis]|uniref:LexA family protein n=1 Tax=Helcococcus sueciensis TaxID=241555 RepID=UPI0004050D84|nr:S24 family peptidase [Helcococcus sueciensis]
MRTNTSMRLKEIMNDRNLRQVDILRKAEPYSKKYNIRLARNDLSQYVSGKVEPSQEKLTILALALGVSEPWLMGYDVPMVKPNNVIDITDSLAKKIPILGTIACGEPIWVYENFDGYFVADTSIKADFIVKAKGDSMIEAEIYDNDLVFLKKVSDVDNGKIAAVLIDNEATLKKIVKTDNAIILQPCNQDYQPIVLTNNEDVMILGEMVGVYQIRNS